MQLYRTFLYAVRDAPALRVKYGYATAPDLARARKQLESGAGPGEGLATIPTAAIIRDAIPAHRLAGGAGGCRCTAGGKSARCCMVSSPFWGVCRAYEHFCVCDWSAQEVLVGDRRLYMTSRSLLRCLADAALSRGAAGRVVLCVGRVRPAGRKGMSTAWLLPVALEAMLRLEADAEWWGEVRDAMTRVGLTWRGSTRIAYVRLGGADLRETARVLSRNLHRVQRGALHDARLEWACCMLARHRRRAVLMMGVWRQVARTARYKRELIEVACHPLRLTQIE